MIIISACQQQNEISNPNGIFSKTDLSELNSIVNDFDKILMTEYKTDSKTKAYQEYSKQVNDEMRIPIPNGLEKLGKEVMTLGVFNKIWWKYDYSTGNSGNFNINPKSEYLTFLKVNGENSELIKRYADKYSSVSDLQPSIIAEFARNIESQNLEDKNIRLIFAIHYLTLINR